jgi:3'(2'),5'-bisphosphate nucleotidase
VVAEESVAAGRVPDVGAEFALVDPLDGTKEFVSGSGEFTVNIAWVADGRPVAGVVYAPAVGILYAGDENGAFRASVTGGALNSREPIRAAAPGPAMRVVASRSHLTDETRAFVDRYEVESFVSSGSSLKFCRVAEGAADLYPRLGRTMEWDTAAGHAVLLAAGGSVSTLDGAPLLYGKAQHESGAFANPHFVAAGAFDPFALAAPGERTA